MFRKCSSPKWFPQLVLFILVSPLALLWGEMFTRILLPQNVDSKMNIFETDPIVGFIFKPNATTNEKGKEYNGLYKINSIGLRDREYGPKTAGIFRVLLLGDSFAVSHGLQIEESLSRQLERALQEVAVSQKTPVTFEVINAAAGGYSPFNYLQAYRRWAPIFSPNAAVVALSPDDYECDNDHVRYLIEDGEILARYKDGEEPKKGGGLSVRRLRKWLSWNSEFYVLLRNFFYYSDLVGRITLSRNPGGLENDTQMQLYLTSYRDNVTKEWAKSFSYLQQLRDATAADGVAMALIPVPLKLEIDSAQYRQTLLAKNLTDEQLDLDQQLREISAFCKKNNIVGLDPRPGLRERHAQVACYFTLDGHWNAEGVRAAASSLAKQWLERGLPPWANLTGQVVN